MSLRLEDSDFAKFPVSSDGSLIPDLVNDIHPLLQRSKFEPEMSEYAYSLLEAPLKLASRMLMDDRAVHYIVTLTDGRLHSIDSNNNIRPEISPDFLLDDSIDEVRLIRCPRSSRVTASMRERSKAILMNLVPALDDIYISAQISDDDRTFYTNTEMPEDVLRSFPAATTRKLEITLSDSTIWGFLSHEEHSFARLAFHHGMARTLVHEIIHVLSCAVHGFRSLSRNDVFVEGYNLNEVGLNIETALFGGFIGFDSLRLYCPQLSEVGEVPLLTRYPCQKFLNLYEEDGLPIRQRWPLNRYHMVSRIPWSFLASMFTEHFWTKDITAMRDGPIQPPRLCSWIYAAKRTGETWRTHTGYSAINGTGGSMPCRADDMSLPQQVKDDFSKIVGLQGRQ